MIVLGSSLAAIGCAVASEDVDGVTPNRRDGGRSDTGVDEEDTSTTEEDSGSTADSGSSTTDTGSSTTDSGSSSTDTGSSTTDTGSGTPCSKLGSSECASSFTDLGSVSGDKGSGTKTASGSDSQWFHVLVSEDDSSLFSSVDLKVRVTLSPTKGNFDLYLYQGKAAGDGGGVECTTASSSSTNASGDDVASLKWSDNRPIGGFDDTRTISIEVRATDAVCADASWSLLVEGNK